LALHTPDRPLLGPTPFRPRPLPRHPRLHPQKAQPQRPQLRLDRRDAHPRRPTKAPRPRTPRLLRPPSGRHRESLRQPNRQHQGRNQDALHNIQNRLPRFRPSFVGDLRTPLLVVSDGRNHLPPLVPLQQRPPPRPNPHHHLLHRSPHRPRRPRQAWPPNQRPLTLRHLHHRRRQTLRPQIPTLGQPNHLTTHALPTSNRNLLTTHPRSIRPRPPQRTPLRHPPLRTPPSRIRPPRPENRSCSPRQSRQPQHLLLHPPRPRKAKARSELHQRSHRSQESHPGRYLNGSLQRSRRPHNTRRTPAPQPRRQWRRVRSFPPRRNSQTPWHQPQRSSPQRRRPRPRQTSRDRPQHARHVRQLPAPILRPRLAQFPPRRHPLGRLSPGPQNHRLCLSRSRQPPQPQPHLPVPHRSRQRRRRLHLRGQCHRPRTSRTHPRSRQYARPRRCGQRLKHQ